MKKLTPKKLLIWILVADLLALVSWVLFGVSSLNRGAELTALSAKIAEATGKKDRLSGLRQVVEETAVGRAVLAGHFVDSNNKADFIEKLEETAGLAGVKFELNRADETAGLKFDLSVRGGFGSVHKFIALLENMPYSLEIEKLALAVAPGEKNQKGVWSANMIVNIKSFKK